MYQYGTIATLLSGHYGDKIAVQKAKEDKNDFALGAGVGLGEVVAVDGEYFRCDPHGKIAAPMENSQGLAFLTATKFVADPKLGFEIPEGSTVPMKEFQARIMEQVKNNQLFVAVKIKGSFKQLLLRSENYCTVSDLTHGPCMGSWLNENENRYESNDCEGTGVMFYAPHFAAGIGVPGYHTHFITKDKKLGGHVLGGSIGGGCKTTVEIMTMKELNVRIGDVVDVPGGKIPLDGLARME